MQSVGFIDNYLFFDFIKKNPFLDSKIRISIFPQTNLLMANNIWLLQSQFFQLYNVKHHIWKKLIYFSPT